MSNQNWFFKTSQALYITTEFIASVISIVSHLLASWTTVVLTRTKNMEKLVYNGHTYLTSWQLSCLYVYKYSSHEKYRMTYLQIGTAASSQVAVVVCSVKRRLHCGMKQSPWSVDFYVLHVNIYKWSISDIEHLSPININNYKEYI